MPLNPIRGQQADGQEGETVVERLKARTHAIFVEHREDSHARARIVLAVEVTNLRAYA